VLALDCPKGFRFNGMHCGLKDKAELFDLSMIASDVPALAAGVFTQNHFPGEPVKLARERLKSGRLQALVINSRYSNVATGSEGRRRAEALCRLAAEQLHIDEQLVLISSTGIIGRQYPGTVIENALPQLKAGLENSSEAIWRAARGIMTTDTIPKALSTKVGNVSIAVMAKGSGMICPNMATMLSFILTDADLSGVDLPALLRRVVDRSFNNLSIDFDTSTSDSCFIMANGMAGKIELAQFEDALSKLCVQAAETIVRDGEGVTKLIDCRVSGGQDAAMVRAVASSIINSPLVKTMITGADPNWGRLIMAIGKVQDARLAGIAPSIAIVGHKVFESGAPHAHDLKAISRAMKEGNTVLIEVNLHRGDAEVQFLGGNLTNDYVAINADYTT
jgi:glutamate N-acetyltransferase / amino-acid N-acetyltransferase